MHTLLRAAALAVAAALAGCTYPASVRPVSTPAVELFPGDNAQIDISQYFEPELAELGHIGDHGGHPTCSLNRYPVKMGPALVSSIRAANEAAFRSVGVSERPNVGTASAKRHLSFERVTSRASAYFPDSLWTVTARGFVEIVVRVTVYDDDRYPLWMDIISGVGRGEGPGDGCERGAEVLGTAAEEAIRRAVDEYVEKIIKAGRVGVSAGA